MHCDRGVTKSEFLAIGGDHVAARFEPTALRPFEQRPILGSHDDPRAGVFLQLSRTTLVITMRMSDEDCVDHRSHNYGKGLIPSH